MKEISSYLSIVLFFIVLLSCEKECQNQVYPFEAEVLGINMDCGIHEIKFLNNLDRVIELCGKSVIEGIYIAGNLPDSLKLEGLEIELNIGKPTSDQFHACTTMGSGLNWVWVTHAKPK